VNLNPIAVPVAFKVPFDPANIDQSRDYVATAAIFDASNRWTNPTGVPVITKGNPITGVTIPVGPFAATTTSSDNGLSTLGTILAIIGIAALIVAVIVFLRSRRPPPLAPEGPGEGGVPGPDGNVDAGPDPGSGAGQASAAGVAASTAAAGTDAGRTDAGVGPDPAGASGPDAGEGPEER
jgi:hypothetical protein